MKNQIARCLLIALVLCSSAIARPPVGSAFTYQGRIKQSGVLISGFCDFKFTLWNDATASAPGNQVGGTPTFEGVNALSVDKGLFNATLNFGSAAFDGNARWLQIAMRFPSGPGSYVTVLPRQVLSAAPYAVSSAGWTQEGGNSVLLQGDVGIGTSNPTATLDIKAAAAVSLLVESSVSDASLTLQSPSTASILFTVNQPKWQVYTDSSSHLYFRDAVDGVIKVRFQDDNQVSMQVYGGACATGGFMTCSDARLKKEVADIPDALSIVNQLRGVEFNWRRAEFPERQFDKSRQIGFIAQEVKPILPEVVFQDSDGFLAVDYGRLTPVLVEAVKELDAKAKNKDEIIAQQQAQINALAARLDAMEVRQKQQDDLIQELLIKN